MHLRQLLFTTTVLLIVSLHGCGGATSAPGQVYSASREDEETLGEANVWKVLSPPLVITLSDTGSIVALFVAECHGKPIRDEGTGTIYGVPVEIRIRIGGDVAFPQSSMLTSGPLYSTNSFLASMQGLPPATYSVIPEWKSESGEAKVRNRSLTAWIHLR
jgi:hypothetical protein